MLVLYVRLNNEVKEDSHEVVWLNRNFKIETFTTLPIDLTSISR